MWCYHLRSLKKHKLWENQGFKEMATTTEVPCFAILYLDLMNLFCYGHKVVFVHTFFILWYLSGIYWKLFNLIPLILNSFQYWIYPLVNLQKAIENGPVEIVDLPSYKMVMFYSYVNLYQVGYIPITWWAPWNQPTNLPGTAAFGADWAEGGLVECQECGTPSRGAAQSDSPKLEFQQGLVNVPFWEYWTSPYSSHDRPYT